MGEGSTLGQRIASVRKRCGLTQRELAEASGLSVSLIRKLEQGERDDGGIRLETAHKLAITLRVPTSTLVTEPDAPVSSPQSAQRWEPVRRALEGTPGGHQDNEPTIQGIRSAFEDMVPLLL